MTSQHQASSAPSVVASIVPGHLRAATLPKKFPGMFLVFESLVYRYLGAFSKDYSGGYWDFIELSNGGFYMSLQASSHLHLTISSNGFQGKMTSDAASVVVNLYALCHLANQHKTDYLIDMYHALRSYACEHPEASRIISAID